MSNVLKQIKPIIKYFIVISLSEDKEFMELLRSVTHNDLKEIVNELLQDNSIKLNEIAKEISIGLAKSSNNYIVKLSAKVIDDFYKVKSLFDFIKDLKTI